jgi:hypothetical protein
MSMTEVANDRSVFSAKSSEGNKTTLRRRFWSTWELAGDECADDQTSVDENLDP